ncbi:hypothetical protein OH77DRAFT_1509666 [Trametes cingulata]|nr:hypothetical protein OH77DRAFT_1509666 [Trametes cingulata]
MSTRRRFVLLLALAVAGAIAYVLHVSDVLSSRTSSLNNWPPQLGQDRLSGSETPQYDQHVTAGRLQQSNANKVFDIFSEVLVVSRPSRVDRRATMERLRLALGIHWTYVDAVSYDEPGIQALLDCVRSVRRRTRSRSFKWPPEHELQLLLRAAWGLSTTKSSLVLGSRCFYSAQSSLSKVIDPSWGTFFAESRLSGLSFATPLLPTVSAGTGEPMTCATKNHVHGVKFEPWLLPHRVLTPAKVACWYSHLVAIHLVAQYDAVEALARDVNPLENYSEAFLILEDDIDMEQTISQELRAIWGLLPPDWDIVFLGHCWSNESYHPALMAQGRPSLEVQGVGVHPSFAPKCTHAYAINPASARRLLLYLSYPLFAYSRPFDQALAWLVQDKQVKAFSVVPSIVVQHKVSGSDIDQGAGGTGSKWRDHLKHSVLGL